MAEGLSGKRVGASMWRSSSYSRHLCYSSEVERVDIPGPGSSSSIWPQLVWEDVYDEMGKRIIPQRASVTIRDSSEEEAIITSSLEVNFQ